MKVNNMKQKFRGGLLLLLISSFCIIHGNQPNRISTKTFQTKSDENSAIKSTAYSDGLGKKIQNRIDLNTPIYIRSNLTYDAIVSGTEYDEMGQPRKSYKATPVNASGQFINDLPSKASTYYSPNGRGPDAKGFPFSETEYNNDLLGKVRRSSFPGEEFSLDHNSIHNWYSSNLIPTDQLTEEILDNLEPPEDLWGSYLNIITKDADRNFSQEIKDNFDQVVKRWSHDGTNEIVSQYKYDILGNMIEEIPPNVTNNAIASTKNEYNALGLLVKKTSADAGTVSYFYDDAGQLIKMITAEGERKGNAISYTYDAFGRNTSTYYDDIVVNMKFYDNTTKLAEYIDWLELDPEILLSLQNCNGRLAAEVSINEQTKSKAIDLYSYNDEGFISCKVKSIPGLPVQKIKYEYNLQGKVLKEIYISSSTEWIKKFTYDNDGRLSKICIVDNNDNIIKELSSFIYNDVGLLTTKRIGTETVTYTYNIRDWVELINSDHFREDIYYYTKPSFLPTDYKEYYSGNIAAVALKYNGLQVPQNITQSYRYDKVNRLKEVVGSSTDFNSSYDYDAIGRFQKKIEGTSKINAHEHYTYFNGTNRIKNTDGSSIVNYLYDADGNLVIDFQKKMIIKYDWRNLPVYFRFFESIPGTNKISYNNQGTYEIIDPEFSADKKGFKSLDKYMESRTDIKLLSTVHMIYDAAGNRVLKLSSK